MEEVGRERGKIGGGIQGKKYLVLGTWYLILGTWYFVLGTLPLNLLEEP